MDRRFALSIHDLKVSGNKTTIEHIKNVQNKFSAPLTVHLVFDTPLKKESAFYNFLKESLRNNKIEIVFHGLKHRCSKRVLRILSFYHKNQAEYLEDSEELRVKTGEMFAHLSGLLKTNPGICPPCWIAGRRNLRYLKKLNPQYLESLLFVSYKFRRIFTFIISLGSSKKSELFFLKIIGNLMLRLSLISKNTRLRVAIHECDLSIDDSIKFLSNKVELLRKHGFRPVLMKHLQ